MVILHTSATPAGGLPASAAAPGGDALVGASLFVSSLEQSIAFLHGAFGFQLVASLEQEAWPRAVLATGT